MKPIKHRNHTFLVPVLMGGLAVGSLFSACTGTGISSQPTTTQSDKQRIMAPNVPQADMSGLVAGEQAFAEDLAMRLGAEGGPRLFFSPLSIFEAMGMVHAGARGDTAEQLASGLHFDLPTDRLFPAIDALDLALASRGAGAQGKDGQPFRLRVVNAAWGQTGYHFEQDYLDTLALYYGAGMFLVDYAGDTEGARRQINTWVADETEQRIQDLIPQGILSPLTRLVLTNAIYFNAAWKYPFEKDATNAADFTLQDGTQIMVDMMHELESLGHVRLSDLDAVELPYDGDEVSMIVILPDAGRFDAVEADLANRLPAILQGLQVKQVELSLPKFRFTSTLRIDTYLKDMGVEDLFDPTAADLSGMDGRHDLYVSAVLHKAFVAVDEAGTEAAAATAVVVGTTGIPEVDATVTVDRPFLFVIRDIPTGAFLFMGSVRDPSAQN